MIRRSAAFAFPILAVVALAACPTARMHVPAVDFTVAAAPASVRPGGTLRLVATVGNPTSDTLAMEFGDACTVSFYVRAEATDAVVEPAGGMWPCEGPARTVRLAPGASERFEHAWAVADTAAAGDYTAYAVLSEHHLTVDGEREYKGGDRSNEVAVRVEAQ
jgi:Intracellular proteinase inhibitor